MYRGQGRSYFNFRKTGAVARTLITTYGFSARGPDTIIDMRIPAAWKLDRLLGFGMPALMIRTSTMTDVVRIISTYPRGRNGSASWPAPDVFTTPSIFHHHNSQ